MIYLLITYYVVSALCVVYAIFNPKDVLSWLWVKGKTIVLWLWNKIKGLQK